MALEKFKNEAKNSVFFEDFLSSFLQDKSMKDIYTIIFNTITKYQLSKQQFGNFASIAEMSNWLALDFFNQVGNIDLKIESISDTKYEKYDNVKII